MADHSLEVIGGVDTHGEVHVAAAVDGVGRILGTADFPSTPAGHRQLLGWLRRHGALVRVGVEGTGSYGAGLARHLTAEGVAVVEVDRPNRKTRRQRGKSDPIDAEAAARAALSGEASGVPKSRDGDVEAIRALRVARRSAIKARTQAMAQLHALVVSAPDELRDQLRQLSPAGLVATATRFRVGEASTVMAATKLALKELAQRVAFLNEQVGRLDAAIAPLLKRAAPKLLALKGVGPDVAGTLLVTAGDNPDRLRSESSFAHLCGAAPIPASSGKIQRRHRLNRGGDRDANRALYHVVIVRMATDARTRHYVERRTKEGLTKREIIRCLKRYVAREIYACLVDKTTAAPCDPHQHVLVQTAPRTTEKPVLRSQTA